MGYPLPWHDTDECAKCGGPIVPCARDSLLPYTSSNPAWLQCAACGDDFIGTVAQVARAWWSLGAYDGHEHKDPK